MIPLVIHESYHFKGSDRTQCGLYEITGLPERRVRVKRLLQLHAAGLVCRLCWRSWGRQVTIKGLPASGRKSQKAPAEPAWRISGFSGTVTAFTHKLAEGFGDDEHP